MKIENYGVYLYGSESRKQNIAGSDVDLVIIANQPWRPEDTTELGLAMMPKHPEWHKRNIDVNFILVENKLPQSLASVASLACLQNEKATPVWGSHLLPSAYQPNWQEFFKNQQAIVSNWMKSTRHADAQFLFTETLRKGHTRFLMSICFSLAHLQKLQSSPNAWIFHREQIQNPLLNKAHDLLRMKWGYKVPQTDADRMKLMEISKEISFMANPLQLQNAA